MNVVNYTDFFGLLKGLGFDKLGHVYGTDCRSESDWIDRGGRRLKEAMILGTMAINHKGENCIELGTSTGESAHEFAKNIIPGVLWTVNLVPSQYTRDMSIITHLLPQEQIGRVYREAGCHNVNQIYSSTLGWVPPDYLKDVAFVFVDACHDRSYVFRDSMKYWPLIKSGGFIVWHDFCPALRDNCRTPWIAEVMKGIEDFIEEMGFENSPIHNQEITWLGIMRKE